MRNKNGKRVISNYPIYDTKSKSYSYMWRSDYVYETVTNSMIVLDEAYRDFNSREYKKFNTDMHTFFATNRHNGNDILLIAQNPQRIDTVLREMANMFLYVQAFKIPLIWRPVFFKVMGYLMVEDFTANRPPYYTKRYFFRKNVAKGYDTHYYKLEGSEPTFEKWFAEPDTIQDNDFNDVIDGVPDML